MAPFKEQQHPFYKPLWVRIVILVVVAAWLGFEIQQGSAPMWIAIAAVFFVYSFYMFFLTWPKDGPPADGSKDDAPPPG